MALRCLLFLASLIAAVSGHAEARPFSFFVVGCMPYGGEESHAAFLRLADDLNSHMPAFTVHVGDTKSGSLPCDDASYDRIAKEFAAFQHPVFYTVGDNEWTDCYRPKCGGFDPLERLELIRQRFFAREVSLGNVILPLESQRSMPGFEKYVENTRWSMGGVLFVGLHVVGSNNNLRHDDMSAIAEYQARDAANLSWLKASFVEASEAQSTAVVVLIQANPFSERGEARSHGFANFVRVLREETLRWGRPVLLVHADSHYFRVDKPLRNSAGQMIEDFTRLEVFGGDNLHAVEVQVAPGRAEDPFTIRPHFVKANRRSAG